MAGTSASEIWPVTIGRAARLSDVSAKMVRHYESMGLLQPVPRTDGGYRQYTEADVHRLRFIKRCRDLGFSTVDMASLVQLWQDQTRSNAQVQSIARKHMQALEGRIAALQAMQRSLQQLVSCCHGDGRPECPILDDLAGGVAQV